MSNETHAAFVAITQMVGQHKYVLLGTRGPVCNNAGQLGLPGGRGDADELTHATAARELEEEINIKVHQLDLDLYCSARRKQRDVYIYEYALQSLSELSTLKLSDECVDVEWVDQAGADRLKAEGKLHYSADLFRVFEGFTATV